MKKLILLLSFLFTIILAFSNVAPTSSAYVSELYFDVDGDWTIELYFTYYDSEMDTGYVMITPTDTAHFAKFPDSTNIILLTNEDLSKPISIDKTGDLIRFENWFEDMEWYLTGSFIFGDYPNSGVNAPYFGQSLVSKSGKVVKDTASSLGYQRDPAKGILNGHIYDSTGVPLPFIRIQTYGIEARTIWPDENGFFTDSLYAKNYGIFIYNDNPEKIYSSIFTIEPDSITTHNIYLPVTAEINFSGMCLLSDSNDFSGINIILTPECPFAPNDTLFTDSTGYFTETIMVGHYMFRYSHQGFLPYSTFLPEDIFSDFDGRSQTLTEGQVHEIQQKNSSGRWINDYPYWIYGDITIDLSDSLILDPGVRLIFQRRNNINVYGTLLSEGTKEESIVISNAGTGSVLWYSLSFYNESSSNSKLRYTEISNNFSGIHFYNASPEIDRSLILGTNQIDFFGNSSPTIINSEISPNVYPGIICYNSSKPFISRNLVLSEIICDNQSSPKFYNNDFYGFWTAIICYENGMPVIDGNIFQRGGYALDITNGNAPTIMEHNIFFDLYEPIWTNGEWIPGFAVLDTTNINGDTCDMLFNLFMDPMLTDPDNANYNLMPGSPCIDAGNPEFEYDPDSTITDIGALYFDQSGVFVNDRKNTRPEIKLYHFPNPATNDVNFVVEGNSIYKLENACIRIYDLSGIQVGEIPCPFVGEGFGKKIYRYDFDSQGAIQTGTYLYTFEANGQILFANKMILVR